MSGLSFVLLLMLAMPRWVGQWLAQVRAYYELYMPRERSKAEEVMTKRALKGKC